MWARCALRRSLWLPLAWIGEHPRRCSIWQHRWVASASFSFDPGVKNSSIDSLRIHRRELTPYIVGVGPQMLDARPLTLVRLRSSVAALHVAYSRRFSAGCAQYRLQ